MKKIFKSEIIIISVKLKLVGKHELVCCWQSLSILLKVVNDIVKEFSVMLMGIPFTVALDRGDDHILDCLMKVWVLHGLGLFTLNIGCAGGE